MEDAVKSQTDCIMQSQTDRIMQSQTDRISELPDDILLSIISDFRLDEIIKASLLSRRWRHICASVPALSFLDITMFPICIWADLDCADPPACLTDTDVFIRAVNHSILNYNKDARLLGFHIMCCLGRDSTCDIDRWVSFAVSMGVEELCLDLRCMATHEFDKRYIFRHELLSQCNNEAVNKLQSLAIHWCILGPGVINLFSSLKELTLTVSLLQDDVDSILSCCLNLNILTLEGCDLPLKLCISGSSSCQLEFLEVRSCTGVKEIELSITSLIGFCHAGELAEVKHVNTFSNVKELELLSEKYKSFDILRMISILRAFPLVEKFCLAVDRPVYHKEGIDMPTESILKHLKEVTFAAFHFKANYIEFAMFLLENAGALEQMVIGPTGEYVNTIIRRSGWDIGERHKICERFQDHPKNALIIIR